MEYIEYIRSLASKDVLLSWTPALAGPAIYLVLVAIGFNVMKYCAPFKLRMIMAYHNLFLACLSFAMFLGSLLEIFIAYSTQPFLDTFCSSIDRDTYSLRGISFFWAYLFYASKYYEFVDTLFIILRKQNLVLLHYYHHAVVIPLCLAFMQYDMFFFLNGVCVNSFIHTLMYWSYYKTAKGEQISWKRYLTIFQMVQFIWGISCYVPWPYICDYSYFNLTGIVRVFWFNQIVLSSFFVLFYLFFKRRYEKMKSNAKEE